MDAGMGRGRPGRFGKCDRRDRCALGVIGGRLDVILAVYGITGDHTAERANHTQSFENHTNPGDHGGVSKALMDPFHLPPKWEKTKEKT